MITGERRTPNEDEIRTLIETWARAVSAGNRKAILAHHSLDLVMFDFPNEIRGLDAYEQDAAGLRKQGDEWVIVHEHHSVRTVEEHFTDPATRGVGVNTMLADSQVATRLPAKDLDRAKRFYSEKLGLQPVEEGPGGLRYRCGRWAGR